MAQCSSSYLDESKKTSEDKEEEEEEEKVLIFFLYYWYEYANNYAKCSADRNWKEYSF